MQEIAKNAQNISQVHSISTSLIVPNPNQPRKAFSEDSIIKLADSIRQFGIIQPLTVRKAGELYELVAGERRLRAAKELNMASVPCIIVNVCEEKSAEISIIENLIREDLNIFEQALAIETLIDTYGLTQEQVAEKLSNSQSFVANKLRLLRLSSEEREIIIKNKLSERHARSLLRILDQDRRREVLQKIISNGLNVSKTEQIVDAIVNSCTTLEAENKANSRTYKNISSFYNAINRAIECAKTSNIEIKSRKIVGDNFTEITIIAPNSSPLNEEDMAEVNVVSRETASV